MPVPYEYPDVEGEQALWSKLNAWAQRRQNYQSQATQMAVQAVGRVYKSQPDVRPGVALAAGQAIAQNPASEGAITQAVTYARGRQVTADVNAELARRATNPAYAKQIDTASQGYLAGQIRGPSDSPNMTQDEIVKEAYALGTKHHKMNWTSPGDYFDKIDSAAKTTVRLGVALGQSGVEAVQNVITNRPAMSADVLYGEGGAAGGKALAGETPEQSQQRYGEQLQRQQDHPLGAIEATTGFQAAKEFVTTGDASLGEGFLPGGLTKEYQGQAAREVRGVVPGTNTANTFGRQVAAAVTQPGTTAYNVLSGLTDAAVTWYADPFNVAAKNVAAARVEAKIIKPYTAEEVGLVDGVRKTVDPMRADQFVQSARMASRLENLAADTDARSIFNALGKRVPPSVVYAVQQAKTPEQVKDALIGVLGRNIRSVDDLPMFARRYQVVNTVKRVLPGYDELGNPGRMLGRMPGDAMDLRPSATAANQIQSLDNFDRFLSSAKVDSATRSKAMNDMVQAMAVGSGADKYAALTAFENTVAESLKAHGVHEELATKLTQFRSGDEVMRLYGTDALGRPTDFGFLSGASGVEDLSAIGPGLLSEGLGSIVQLPDIRKVRRLTSGMSKLLAVQGATERSGNLRLPLALVESFQNKIWKPLTVLRPATTLRIVGEEQARLAAAGYGSMFRHPIDHLLAATHGKFNQLGDTRRPTDILGLGWDEAAAQGHADDYVEAMSGSFFHELADPSIVTKHTFATGSWAPVDKDMLPKQWINGAVDELRQLSTDPYASRLAGGMTTDDLMTWARSTDTEAQAAMHELAARGRTGYRTPGATGKMKVDFADDRSLRAYFDATYKRLMVKTGGENDLLRAVANNRLSRQATQQIEGGEIPNFGFINGQPTPKLLDRLEQFRQSPKAPQMVKYNVTADAPAQLKRLQGGLKDQLDHATKQLFGALFERPTNHLSRSPLFTQVYYDRVAELVPHMAPEAANQMLKNLELNAKTNGFAGKVSEFLGGDPALKKLVTAAGKANGTAGLEEVDQLAKGHALDEVRNLLYDASERSNLSDSLRIAIPFGEAWKEVLTRWGEIIKRNPYVIRRGAALVQGAEGSGFFHANANGDEVFSYPGTALLGGALGVGVGFTGKVSGLNIAGNFLPGVGPVLQIPAWQLMKDKPELDFVRGLLLPYGEPQNLQDLVVPDWLEKTGRALIDDPNSTGIFGNTYMEVLAALKASGKYADTPEGRDQLESDAKWRARVIAVLRGLGQSVAPSAPSPQFSVKTNKGDMLVDQLRKDYQTMYDQDPQTATQRFLETYGDGPFIYAVSKTKTVNGGLSPTAEFGDWERQHGGVFRRYKDVAGYFAPTGSDFDFEVYSRQLATGQRKKLTDEEYQDAVDTTIARWKYNQKKDAIGPKPNKAQTDWLRGYKQALEQQYPGFARQAPTQDLGVKIKELGAAVDDPSLENNDVASAVRGYLKLRDKALAAAKQRGLSSLAGDKVADLRAWLDGAGMAIVKETPTFQRVWDDVLSHEVETGQEATNAAA